MTVELSITEEQMLEIAQKWIELGTQSKPSIEEARLQGFNGLALDIGLMPAIIRIAKKIQDAADKEEARKDRLAGFLIRNEREVR